MAKNDPIKYVIIKGGSDDEKAFYQEIESRLEAGWNINGGLAVAPIDGINYYYQPFIKVG